MRFRNDRRRYAASVVLLHWLTLVLVAAAYGSIELRELFVRGSDMRDALKTLHFLLGLGVLALMVVRLGVRAFAGPAPPIAPAPDPWMQRASAFVQAALYALLFGAPMLGWALLGAEGERLPPFFGAELPPLVPRNEGLAEALEDLHETAGQLGYGLIGLHAAAALFHHYVRRDSTLERMLPG